MIVLIIGLILVLISVQIMFMIIDSKLDKLIEYFKLNKKGENK